MKSWSAARQAAAALACFGLSVFAMCADSWWVHNPAATDLAAFIFIPLALTFLWSLLTLANLTAGAIRRLDRQRVATLQSHPDYSAIAAMEREIYGETFEHEEAPKAGTLRRDRREPAKLTPCYCNYCYGRAGVHGDDAKALYQAEVAAAMAATPSVKPAYGTSNVNYGGIVRYWTEETALANINRRLDAIDWTGDISLGTVCIPSPGSRQRG